MLRCVARPFMMLSPEDKTTCFKIRTRSSMITDFLPAFSLTSMRLGEPSSHNDPPIAAPHTYVRLLLMPVHPMLRQQAATPAPNGMQTAATGESPKEEPLPQELPPIVLDNKVCISAPTSTWLFAVLFENGQCQAKSPLLMAADITTAVLETSQKRVAAVLTKTRERLLDFPEFSDDLSDALISDKVDTRLDITRFA